MRFLSVLLLLFAAAGTACADTMTGVVIVVIDGDTVLFKPDHYHPSGRAFLKIRLADIDAPEHDQPYGDAATQALAARVLNQWVEVDTVATDVYGRTLAHIRMDGDEVGADLVRRGLAWAATRSRNASGLKAAQRQARLARRGLWQDATPMPPWVWRRTHPVAGHWPADSRGQVAMRPSPLPESRRILGDNVITHCHKRIF